MALLISVARFVISAAAAIALVVIIASLVRWGWSGFNAGGLWALLATFPTFMIAVGVLVLFEIRDLLLAQVRSRTAADQPLAGHTMTPAMRHAPEVWRTIGWLTSRVWLPFQSQRERLLIDHLALHEQSELFNRLATVTVGIVATTVGPILLAFVLLSPVAVCFAATAIAANLFIIDWFKKRHKSWLYATSYAREQAIVPPGD
ncbi:MAG TPA: hypothetical protein VJ783_24185 [Pirellulales bacterium]|nr:hypothetical protein [Pirellulales bacterium]